MEELPKYDVDGIRRAVGIRTKAECARELGLGSYQVYNNRYVKRGTLGACVDLVMALGGEHIGSLKGMLFECRGVILNMESFLKKDRF